ncbi:MAG: hypothetical protein CMO80_22930 [Verrucomicrobiales bacterium]|nr:hypothetical protein [Verrucomicrobiales bacterium]|tara:strand:+ start:38 stop:271 length:234 start_codon:yes stop_codon:yes gene_type:complete
MSNRVFLDFEKDCKCLVDSDLVRIRAIPKNIEFRKISKNAGIVVLWTDYHRIALSDLVGIAALLRGVAASKVKYPEN